ncbi:DUF1439 domain-containing protein [Arcobacter sp. LA11]|uniref:DUF1439 domain-containing protein n=1 Tax=Arcobacter sp. LA11 TaxID=1898176 RepID=UPI0009355C41|nr:DUF1439 domain-containing protein [Arcobacter sp. LA11]
MNFHKKLQYLLSSILFLFFLTGCVHKIDKQGLTVSITPNELTQSFDDSFPINKDFIFGNIKIDNPTIEIPKNSKRINADINLAFATMFTEIQYGNFSISGKPLFDKKESSVYLQNVKIDNFKFAELKLGNEFTKTFLKSLNPMVNQLFRKYPIYKIPKESFQGSFVKDIQIKDSQLLVTYGL